MIFLDANVLLRFLTAPTTEQDVNRKAEAHALLARIDAGELAATTSEVVLHEVSYILTSSRQYRLAASQATILIRIILAMKGLEFPADDRAVYIRALDLWEEHPKLEFSDAVIAARCEHGGHELATFDRHFDALPSINRWSLAES